VGTGGGGPGSGGTTTSSPFPSQACLTDANTRLAQMTNDQKYAQLMMLDRAQVTSAQVGTFGFGAVYSSGGSAPTNNSPTGWADMIDGYRSASRGGAARIPIFYGLDSVHGLGPVPGATVFPHNIGFGATRNAALAEEAARVIAEESLGVGADLPFAPVLAVVRDERWGRTYEGFAETSDVVAMLGTAMVRGLQQTTSGSASGILANLKHFVGDGGTAGGVNIGNTSGNEAALRTLHLDPYRPALAARAGSVMASYSSWQGMQIHQSRTLLTDLLKGELGFGGFILSDYNACFRLGFASGTEGDRQGITACLNAGVDMFMLYGAATAMPNVPEYMLGHFRAVVSGGMVQMSRVDDAVRRILGAKCEMGLFTGGAVNRTLTGQVGSAAHRMVARRVVRESMVVLKNDQTVLPIAKTATVALGGKTAQNTGNQAGGWTISWQGRNTPDNYVTGATSIRAGIETVIGAASRVVFTADGSAPGAATVGIAVIGETPYAEGCGDIPPQADTFCSQGSGGLRPNSLSVDAADVMVVQRMKQANPNIRTVVVLVSGRPMILPDALLQNADAIIAAWLPGSEGAGVADVLFGDFKPTGKLPHSWPRSMAQIPINQGDATYDPLYPYGHGLTYP
jgi:beta-glucosidase